MSIHFFKSCNSAMILNEGVAEIVINIFIHLLHGAEYLRSYLVLSKLKNFPASHGKLSFITAFISALHLSLS